MYLKKTNFGPIYAFCTAVSENNGREKRCTSLQDTVDKHPLGKNFRRGPESMEQGDTPEVAAHRKIGASCAEELEKNENEKISVLPQAARCSAGVLEENYMELKESVRKYCQCKRLHT